MSHEKTKKQNGCIVAIKEFILWLLAAIGLLLT